MEYVRSFQDIAITDIQAYLASQETPFATSELYSSTDKAKILDRNQRQSEYRLLKDDKVFSLMEALVQHLGATDANYSYLLHKNDITEIRYREGDFFKRHTDYLSMTSNCIEEFTLILCVTPSTLAANVRGGETMIYPYNGKPVPFDTTTPGSGLVFRKDLEHAGNALMAGEKHILTANLWAMRKHDKSNNNQVLLVTFPNEETAGANVTTSSMEHVANQDTSYALPVDLLNGTMLGDYVDLCNRSSASKGQDMPAIVTYECTRYSFQAFGTVAKILLRSYVDEEQIRAHKDCIDYFGPFRTENLFVNLSVEQKDQKPPAKKTKKEETAESIPPDINDPMSLIVCENVSRTNAVCEVARLLGEPYVPFKILFVEGILQSFDGDMGHAGYSAVPITPVACLVGDHNNIFALRKVNARVYRIKAKTLKDMHQQHNFWDHTPQWRKEDLLAHAPGTEDVYLSYQSNEWIDLRRSECQDAEDSLRETGFGLSLKLAYGHENFQDRFVDIMKYIFDDAYDEKHTDHFIVFPGCEDRPPQDQGNEAGHDGSEELRVSNLFHRDAQGRSAFTAEEAEAASDYIASFELEERVKASLQQKRFDLPQETTDMEGLFCNDQVYGKLNILWVTGAIRLDRSSSQGKQVDKVSFDVWPPESAKMDPRSFRIPNRREQRYWEIYPSDLDEDDEYDLPWDEVTW